MQDVRRAALGERLALFDAEAVLLVDHRDGEVAELDALLDQGVRADDVPRTLALTVYGDLAVSEIAKPPAIAQPMHDGRGSTRGARARRTTRLRTHLDEAGRRTSSVR